MFSNKIQIEDSKEENIGQEKFSSITFEECPDEVVPYTIIDNALIRDSSISPNCRWLIIYLLSNKPGWVINVKQLLNHCKDYFRKDKLYKIIKEAIAAGYMKKVQTRNGNKYGVIKYFVSRKPKFKEMFTKREISEAENQFPVKHDNKEEHISKNKHKERERETTTSPPTSSSSNKTNETNETNEKTSFGLYVRLLPVEFKSLCDEFTEKIVNKTIDRMNLHLATTFIKPYKNYFLKLRAWIIEDLDKIKSKERSLNAEALNGQNSHSANVVDNSVEHIEQNKVWIRNINKKYFNKLLEKKFRIIELPDHVYFFNFPQGTNDSTYFFFNELKFKDEVARFMKDNKLI